MDEKKVLSLLNPPVVVDPSDWCAFCIDLVSRITHVPSSELSSDMKRLSSIIAALLGISVSSAQALLRDSASTPSESKRSARKMLIALAYNMQRPSSPDQVATACKILDTSVEAGFPGDGGSALFNEVPKCFSGIVVTSAAAGFGGGAGTTSVNASASVLVPNPNIFNVCVLM